MTARNNHWLYLFARLRSGLTREQAEAQINVPFTALIRDVEYPPLRSGIGSDRDRELFQQRRLLLRDGSHGRDANRGETQMILLLMFTITGFVLAIACANVANLLLARVADRSTEMSVRLSLGASSSRLIRLLLVESVVLGALGAAGALIVARMTLSGLAATMPAEDMTMLAFEIDWTVLLFSLALGIGTSVVFGLFPAVHGVRSAVGGGLQASSTRMAGSRAANRFRASLATSQVALATALLATAGLFVVSLVNLARTELGIRREGLVTFRLSPYLNGIPAGTGAGAVRSRRRGLGRRAWRRLGDDIDRPAPREQQLEQQRHGRRIRCRTRHRHGRCGCARRTRLFPHDGHSDACGTRVHECRRRRRTARRRRQRSIWTEVQSRCERDRKAPRHGSRRQPAPRHRDRRTGARREVQRRARTRAATGRDALSAA